MAAKSDSRKMEKTGTPGIYRRHTNSCKGGRRCGCPYVVRWKADGKFHKQMFGSFELAREHKNKLGSGLTSRKPLSKETVAGYYATWIASYRGRTTRGVQESTVREYKISFKHHILPLPIAHIKLRDLSPPDVRDWFEQLERRNASPATIKRARIALRVMLACAIADGEIMFNAAAGAPYIPSERVQVKHAKPEPKRLGEKDIIAIQQAMSDQWQVFFYMLAQTGVRVGELLGLTWQHVHLGDDAHITVTEQVYRGKRKQLKTDASEGRVPLSPFNASALAELRPENVKPETPVFASTTGTELNYANVYNRVLRPALVKAGIAIKVGETPKGKPIWDYQRVGFHAYRHACLTLLPKLGKRPAQAQSWARHAQLTTTMGYTHTDDDGMGTADGFDELLGAGTKWGQGGDNSGDNQDPETAANDAPLGMAESASQSQISEQP
jgi:integrase